MKAVLTTFALLALVSHAAVAGGLKIATVNVRKVFNTWTYSVEIQKRIDKTRETLEQENNDRLSVVNEYRMELNRVRQQFQLNQSTMSEEDKNKVFMELSNLQREALALEQDRRDFLRKSRRRLADEMSTEAKLILDHVMQAAQVYAREKKFDMVIEAGGSTTRGVPLFVHLEGTVDITDQLINRLNENSGN